MNIIVARNQSGYIGAKGALMYSIPADMRYFVQHTAGKTVVMGKHTLQSLPKGMGLKGRRNIVLSTSMTKEEASAANVEVAKNTAELFKMIDVHSPDVFVIGGGKVYAELLPYCNTLYITQIYANDKGETKFPAISKKEFTFTRTPLQCDNGYNFRFYVYTRR